MGFFIGTGLILIQEDKYILVQEVRAEKIGFFNLPAGTLEIGESLTECMAREAKEEVGIDIVLKDFVGIYQTVLKNGNNILFFVFAAHADADAIFQSNEHAVIRRFSLDEIAKLDQAGKLRAPTVLKAIKDYCSGQRFPLSAAQVWNTDNLAAITVDKRQIQNL